MSQISHIQKNTMHIESRSAILKSIRDFFASNDFIELDPPALVALAGQEPYLTPVPVSIHNETGKEFNGYLHTSPEYAMKKALAAGFENIYAMGKCYRDRESFGGSHNPEFTMIEWYRAHEDMTAIMDDCEKLIGVISKVVEPKHAVLSKPFARIHMRDLWQQSIGANLDAYLDTASMRALCIERGYSPSDDEPYEDLFYRIFLNEIEPTLGKKQPTIVHHYPAQMAALAKLDDSDSWYAERFEIYIDGVELANAFTELTDANEQRTRLEDEQEQRKALGKAVYPIDDDFIKAVSQMPPSAGIALGVDRLVQLYTGCQNIDDVLVLPASKLF